MQSPRIEWALMAAHFGVVDYLRDRGEPDGDTASECIRNIFAVHTPGGRAAFTLTLALGSGMFWRHIVKET